jgi:hypothetical protein
MSFGASRIEMPGNLVRQDADCMLAAVTVVFADDGKGIANSKSL